MTEISSSQSDLGQVILSPTDECVVGSNPTFVITYVVGPLGMAANGSVRINLPHDCWEPFPKLGGYYQKKTVTFEIETKGNAGITPMLESMGQAWAVAFVDRQPLDPGDKIIFTYGVHEPGTDPIRAQTFPEDYARKHACEFSLPFRVFVDTEGKRNYREITDAPRIKVRADKPSIIHAVLPPIIRAGEAVALKCSLLDRFRNRPDDKVEAASCRFMRSREGSSTLTNVTRRMTLTVPELGISKEVQLDEASDNHAVVDDITFDKPGRFRVTVECEGIREEGRSNTVEAIPEKPKLNLYFGDIHGKTLASDGPGTVDEYYQYGRDYAHLDICAVSDHMEFAYTKTPDAWAEVQEKTRDYYEEGRFVTLRAFEWTSNTYGHRNAYFPDDIIEESYWTLSDKAAYYQRELTPEQFYRLFEGREVLLIPHHTIYNYDWTHHNPELERLVEIYSCWGSSEFSGNPLWDKREIEGGAVRDALNRGYRLGIMASSDTHDSCPGRCCAGNRAANINYKHGILGVYAPSLTRRAVYEALKARRCFGATGERIRLEFSINEIFMGEEMILDSPDVPRRLYLKVIGTDKIDRVEIIRNGKAAYTLSGESDFFSATWTDTTPLGQSLTSELDGAAFDYYYARVLQADGNMAWSSPIWIRST
ncbi:MAG: DUF3604 domain-containing protein [Planctomycetes bacterium]|nr:DUF3604 domain-containing protein [Planctomycetota bacterium]